MNNEYNGSDPFKKFECHFTNLERPDFLIDSSHSRAPGFRECTCTTTFSALPWKSNLPPRDGLRSKSTPKSQGLLSAPPYKSGSVIYCRTRYVKSGFHIPWNSPPRPVVHHHFLVPIGALVHINVLNTTWWLEKWPLQFTVSRCGPCVVNSFIWATNMNVWDYKKKSEKCFQKRYVMANQ